jgi:hypothetical protein
VYLLQIFIIRSERKYQGPTATAVVSPQGRQRS